MKKVILGKNTKDILKKAVAAMAAASVMTVPAAFAASNVAPFTTAYEKIDDVVMVPLRVNAEKLGYTVGWNDEGQKVSLTKGAQYATFAIGTDSYSFSKAAPVALGHVPVLYNGDTTYVPLALFTDVLDINSRYDENSLVLSEPNYITIKEIAEDGSLTVEDENFERGVIVHIDENTEITADGKPVSRDTLKAGQLADIEYGDAMTHSIPPQTTAVKIDIQNLPTDVEADEKTEADAFIDAKILTVDKDEKVITLSETNGNFDEVVVNITNDTVIRKSDSAASFDDLKDGDEISIRYADFMTMSIPPMTNAVEIIIK